MQESEENARHIEITDRQGINEEFHKSFQKIYAKQDVNDSSEAIQEILDSGDNWRYVTFRIYQQQGPNWRGEQQDRRRNNTWWTPVCTIHKDEGVKCSGHWRIYGKLAENGRIKSEIGDT